MTSSRGPLAFLVLAFAALVATPTVRPASAATWRSLGPPGATVTALARSETVPGRVYAGIVDGGVFRSDDGGVSWVPARGGLTAVTVHALAVDPSSASTVYAGVESGLYKSEDGGVSWTFHDQGLPVLAGTGEAAAVLALAIDPSSPETLYAATGVGVSKSTDGGLTWALLGTGLTSPSVRRLAQVSQGPDLLYAATDGGGWVLGLDPPPGREGGSAAGAPPPVGPILTSPEFPGFRFQVRITSGGGEVQPVRQEASCLPETICVSGAVPGRSEIFLRIVGPKPNGRLWPTIVKFTTSQVEVWIEQTATNTSRYYRLAPARPGVDELPGLFDRDGFPP